MSFPALRRRRSYANTNRRRNIGNESDRLTRAVFLFAIALSLSATEDRFARKGEGKVKATRLRFTA